MNTAKVGFAIILTCRENRLEILCVKRGHSSPAPGKWSFPGGKLGQGEGTEEAKTIARVRAQCGGGEPPGLPPLIHIIRLLNESSAKGKQQTIYHVFVLDWDKDTSWANWKPSIIPEEADGDIDDSSVNVSFAGEGRKDNKGYMWADLDTLLNFTNQPNSSSIAIDSKGGTLHPGMVKWLQNHGAYVMRTLISRSPTTGADVVDASSTQSTTGIRSSETKSPPDPNSKWLPAGARPSVVMTPAVFQPISMMQQITPMSVQNVPIYPIPSSVMYGQPPRSVYQSFLVKQAADKVTQSHHQPRHIICQYFLKGSCKFGGTCRYLHPSISQGSFLPSPLNSPAPPTAPPTTILPSLPTTQALPPVYHQVQVSPSLTLQPELHSATHGIFSSLPSPTQPISQSVSTSHFFDLKFDLICQINTLPHDTSTSHPERSSLFDYMVLQGKMLYLAKDRVIQNYKVIFSEESLDQIHPEDAFSYVGKVDLQSLNVSESDSVSSLYSPVDSNSMIWMGTSHGSILRYDFVNQKMLKILNGQNEPEITSLLHFVSVEKAQVVVGGNKVGVLFWFMQRMGQEFSVLLTEQKHHSAITALQITGDKIISSSSDGCIHFWSICKPLPVGIGSFQIPGCHSLCSLYTVENFSQLIFITLTRQLQFFQLAAVEQEGDVSLKIPQAWVFGNPPRLLPYKLGHDPSSSDPHSVSGVVSACSLTIPGTGSLFITGLKHGHVKIFSIPQFILSADLIFEDMKDHNCECISAAMCTGVSQILTDIVVATLWSNGIIKLLRVS